MSPNSCNSYCCWGDRWEFIFLVTIFLLSTCINYKHSFWVRIHCFEKIECVALLISKLSALISRRIIPECTKNRSMQKLRVLIAWEWEIERNPVEEDRAEVIKAVESSTFFSMLLLLRYRRFADEEGWIFISLGFAAKKKKKWGYFVATRSQREFDRLFGEVFSHTVDSAPSILHGSCAVWPPNGASRDSQRFGQTRRPSLNLHENWQLRGTPPPYVCIYALIIVNV